MTKVFFANLEREREEVQYFPTKLFDSATYECLSWVKKSNGNNINKLSLSHDFDSLIKVE